MSWHPSSWTEVCPVSLYWCRHFLHFKHFDKLPEDVFMENPYNFFFQLLFVSLIVLFYVYFALHFRFCIFAWAWPLFHSKEMITSFWRHNNSYFFLVFWHRILCVESVVFLKSYPGYFWLFNTFHPSAGKSTTITK